MAMKLKKSVMLNLETLTKRLHPRPVKYFDSVASTQDIAFDWLREGALSGAVVVADEQVSGRGRRGRGWSTPPGTAIAMSVILRPDIDVLPQITMLGALAIAEMLDELGLADVAIKWPNDVLLNGRKVSGVLPEAVWEGDKLSGVSLGMGINVRVDFTGSELESTAISIEFALGKTVKRVDIVAAVLERINAYKLGSPELFAAWKARLHTIGQPVSVMHQGESVTGLAEHVDTDGALLIRRENGEVVRLVAGDVAP